MKNITDKPNISKKSKKLAEVYNQKKMYKETLYWET